MLLIVSVITVVDWCWESEMEMKLELFKHAVCTGHAVRRCDEEGCEASSPDGRFAGWSWRVSSDGAVIESSFSGRELVKNKSFRGCLSLRLMMSGLTTGLERGYCHKQNVFDSAHERHVYRYSKCSSKADAGKILREGARGQG